jgi:ribonuclease HII
MARISPDLSFELPLWAAGAPHLAGLDEAGRGAWAGPVSAAAVILPQDADLCIQLNGVRDSKQMTPRQRRAWAVEIRRAALAWGVGFASHTEIDTQGILPATRLAMQRALAQLALPPQHLLLDAVRLPAVALPQTVLIKGDVHSLSIAAASVLAKTARDELLVAWEQEYPGYGFARHKGYGTAAHRQALQAKGACPLHRFTFAPIRDLKRHQG